MKWSSNCSCRSRWRGFGGANDPQGPGFEAYTWAAGIAASTVRCGVVSTSHVSLNHPIVAAKQCAAIDHISNGRFTLNVVCGWNGPEMKMFDMSLGRHEDRYACAEEWLAIVKRLWTEEDDFDHEGNFYRIKKGYLKPKPLQQPHPAIMNAGASERGRHFAAKNCDLVHTTTSHPRSGRLRRPCCGLSPARARGIRPQHPRLDARLHRARRNREEGARVLPLLR